MPAIRWSSATQIYKLALLPSGIVRGTLSVIGNGVVLDPWALKAEVEQHRGAGDRRSRPTCCMIAETCPLILPFHRDLDALREDASGAGKIGTTRRGIGPAYEDKVGRRAIRVCDLAHLDELGPQLDRLCAHHDALRAGFGEPPVDRARLRADLARDRRFRPALRASRCGATLDEARGARQAHPVRRRAGRAARRRPRHLSVRHLVQHRRRHRRRRDRGWGRRRPGSCWASSRPIPRASAPGPFPTELDDEIGQRLGERGHEFGTVTGRKRRCGWFDAVLVRQSAAVSGITGIALTKTRRARRVRRGEDLHRLPARRRGSSTISPPTPPTRRAVEPIYEEMDGWAGIDAGARSWADLPAQAIKYIRRIEELIRCPVALVSTSPQRDDTILVRDPFAS